MHIKKTFFQVLAVLFFCLGLPNVPLFAADFGLILDLTPGYEDPQGFDSLSADKITFSGSLMPWFSSPLGDTMEVYISAGALAKDEKTEFTMVPELYHTEFTWRPGKAQAFRIGRLYYSDPLGFIAEGLFDGLSWEGPAGTGMVSLGAYYTGFLYKKTAYITVSDDELAEYNSRLDYGDFAESYFAPSRALASLGYSNIFFNTVRLNLALLGQFDLKGKGSYYTSEYLAAKLTVPYKNLFVFEAGGTAEFIETSGEKLLFGFAGEFRFDWYLPGPVQDRLSLGARYASGRSGNSLAEFRPLTTESQGMVLRAKLSGLTVFDAAYTGRLNETFALMVNASYFVQNDLGTYRGIFSSQTDYFLGGEACARLSWSPVSDLSLSLAGGAFFPSLGNTSPDSKPLWLVNLNCIIVLY
jgi:hypothetical protein